MNKKEQEMLDKFFKEETTWFPDHVGSKYLGIFLMAIGCILTFMPYTVWGSEDGIDRGVYVYMVMIELMGLYVYTNRFCAYRENGKMKRVYNLLQYLPVSHKQLGIYRVQKMIKPCLWLAGMAIFFQTMGYVVSYHSFSILTIIIPILTHIVAPMVTLGTSLMVQK